MFYIEVVLCKCYVFEKKLFVLRFQEKISNFILNQNTWLTVADIPTCKNNLHNGNLNFSTPKLLLSLIVYGYRTGKRFFS
jgi:hypothetical protein